MHLTVDLSIKYFQDTLFNGKQHVELTDTL